MVPVAGVDGPTYRPARAAFWPRMLKSNGTGGRTRTGTLLRAGDFESPVSTNFTTPAGRVQEGKSPPVGERAIIATGVQSTIIFP